MKKKEEKKDKKKEKKKNSSLSFLPNALLNGIIPKLQFLPFTHISPPPRLSSHVCSFQS